MDGLHVLELVDLAGGWLSRGGLSSEWIYFHLLF